MYCKYISYYFRMDYEIELLLNTKHTAVAYYYFTLHSFDKLF